jgi:hypothetical protein
VAHQEVARASGGKGFFQDRLIELFAGTQGNGGPTKIRKKYLGEPVMLFVQPNGIAGELVVNTALQFTKLVEAWLARTRATDSSGFQRMLRRFVH